MVKYEILGVSGKRYGEDMSSVAVFVKANNYYYQFRSWSGETVDTVLVLTSKSVDIPLGNWFYVRNFEGKDIVEYADFVEAIDDYFNGKGELIGKEEYL